MPSVASSSSSTRPTHFLSRPGKQARTDEEARRWRACLTVIEEDEPEDVAVYCPTCAKGDFEVDE
jgi:hypothetical protein